MGSDTSITAVSALCSRATTVVFRDASEAWLGGPPFYIWSWLPALLSLECCFDFPLFSSFIMQWETVHAAFLPVLKMVTTGIDEAQMYTANSEAGFHTLQTWYDNSTGLYNTTGWWNAANCLTTIGDLAAIDPKVQPEILDVLANSFVAAPNTNLQTTKVVQPDFSILAFYDDVVPTGVHVNAAANPKGFLNDYYDDEGWWALAWIQAYDITKNNDYLQAAIDIFVDMKNGSSPCGGIWWDKPNTYVNAIANELYLSVAAALANRAPNSEIFLDIAKTQFDWFQESGMINAGNTINDGLDATCTPNNGTVWSYNQGVILGALVELNKASPNTTYLATANAIASAAIKALSVNGVLHDPCEPNCGADGSQFKGVFMRNLRALQQAAPDAAYLDFMASNAAAVWRSRDNTTGALGVDWDGPFIGRGNASLQSSGLDALVAAATFEAKGLGM